MTMKLGTINGYIQSMAWSDRAKFNFDGTIKGLVRSALANGSQDGDIIKANFGGTNKAGAQSYKIIAAPHDDRAGGFWAEKA